MISRNPPNLATPSGNYSHAVEVAAGTRLLFISGQIAEAPDGDVPGDFPSQCERVWQNIREILEESGLGFQNLVKVTTYLTHLDQAIQNSEIRQRVLGSVRPALTVVVVQTLEPRWLLEIEAIAAG